jgi:hypothetical protein
MAPLDVITGTVFIVDAFSVDDIFLWLRIPYRSISVLLQHTTLYICHPSLYFSPVSAHNTVYLSPTALYFSCFSTQHCISVTHRSISLLFQHTTLYTCHPPLYFSPVSAQNTVYLSPTALYFSCFSTQHCISVTHRSISLLFQHTTLHIGTLRNFVLF